MKLICELQEAVNYELLEEENKPKQYFIEGIFMQGGISRFSTHISYQQGCLSYGHSPVKEIALYGSDLYFGSIDPKSEIPIRIKHSSG